MRLILAVAAAVGMHALMSPRRRVGVPVPTTPTLATAIGACLLMIGIGLPGPTAAALGIGASMLPGAFERARARRAASDARDQWPDFLAIVRSRIGSGEPLPDAVRSAARTLGGSFGDLDRAFGGSFLIELEAARSRWSDPVADRVLTTLRIAASTGGAHVDAVLSALATSLSDEMRIRSAHDAALTQQRLTAGVALVAPWAILILSLLTNPQATQEFASPTGRAILAAGGVATTGGFLLARRASRLSAPPRVFE